MAAQAHSRVSPLWLFLIAGLLGLAACSGSEVPGDLLTMEEIEPILMEFQLAESGISQKTISLEDRSNLRDDYYDEILKKYEVDRDRFYESYQYFERSL